MRLAARERASKSASNEYLHEFISQELEYLKITKCPVEILDIAHQIASTSPAREFNVDTETLHRAIKIFDAGAAFYIEYNSAFAIELNSNKASLQKVIIPIKYIRSPKFKPRGCQVVAHLVNDPSQDAPAENTMLSTSGYLPCAFLAGLLEGTWMTFGEVKLRPDAKLIVQVTTASADERAGGIPLSNPIAIPVVAMEDQKFPFSDASASSKSTPKKTTSSKNTDAASGME